MSEKKPLFSGGIESIPGPTETAGVSIVLTDGSRFMCSSSTYFLYVFEKPSKI